ncbi:MAG: RNA polymerase sigma factor [Fimbriiglobus sp.]|nr:RNA polymerase sigma factor [Fimbriiglobus sp.]
MLTDTEADADGLAEQGWITAAQAGDRDAFARLVEVHWQRLRRWLGTMVRDPYLADDLTQETFLKALAALHSFRPGTNFRAWLFRIAHNALISRKRGTRREQGGTPPDTHPDPSRTVEELAEADETRQLVLATLQTLPDDWRAALLLRIDEELSFAQIAEIVKTTEETARWRVFKARQWMLDRLPEGVRDGLRRREQPGKPKGNTP